VIGSALLSRASDSGLNVRGQPDAGLEVEVAAVAGTAQPLLLDGVAMVGMR
jgi:hypothetical protein